MWISAFHDSIRLCVADTGPAQSSGGFRNVNRCLCDVSADYVLCLDRPGVLVGDGAVPLFAFLLENFGEVAFPLVGGGHPRGRAPGRPSRAVCRLRIWVSRRSARCCSCTHGRARCTAASGHRPRSALCSSSPPLRATARGGAILDIGADNEAVVSCRAACTSRSRARRRS